MNASRILPVGWPTGRRPTKAQRDAQWAVNEYAMHTRTAIADYITRDYDPQGALLRASVRRLLRAGITLQTRWPDARGER